MTQQTDAVETDTDSTDSKLYREEIRKINGSYCHYYHTDNHMITTKNDRSDRYCVRVNYHSDTASTSTWCTEVTSDSRYFTLRADRARLCRISRLNMSDAFESLLSDIESGDI